MRKIPTYLESFQLHPVCPKQLPITRISQQLLKLLRILQHVSHTTHALTCIVMGRSLNPPTPNPIRAQAKKVTFFICKLKRLTIGWRKERTLCVYYDNNQLRTWPDTRTLSRTLLKQVESWVNSPFLPLLQGCLTSAPLKTDALSARVRWIPRSWPPLKWPASPYCDWWCSHPHTAA